MLLAAILGEIKNMTKIIRLMRACWAADEKCGGALSREHVISESVLETVGGVHLEPFTVGKIDTTFSSVLDGGGGKVGNGSLTMKSLCRVHNSSLADYDAEGAKLIKALKAVMHDPRSTLFNGGSEDFAIDGHRLEKWLAKTLLNAATYGVLCQQRQTPEEPLPLIPYGITPAHIVDNLYRGASFQAPYGLYVMRRTADVRAGTQDLRIRVGTEKFSVLTPDGVVHEDRYLILYITVSYAGITFLGRFNMTLFPDDWCIENMRSYNESLASQATYRPAELSLSIPKTKSRFTFKFVWR